MLNSRIAVMIGVAIFAVAQLVPVAQAQDEDGVFGLNADSAIFNVEDFGAIADDNLPDDDGVKAALTAALRSGGVLFFPAGIWRLNSTLLLTCDPEGPGSACPGLSQPIQIRGVNLRSTRIISSASPAIAMEAGHQPIGTLLQDFRLTGLLHGNTQQQHGISFCDNTATAALVIERVQIDAFNGDGICARSAFNARIVHNRLESVRTGIRCEECRISVIESNRVSTFSRYGIFVGTDRNNASSQGSVAVRVIANEITHARAFDGHECESAVTGIRIGRGQTFTIESNYFEDITSPVACGSVAEASGIVIRPENENTRDAIIKANFWSGNNSQRAIYIDSSAFFTVLQSTGGAENIVDNGLNTFYLGYRISDESCVDPTSIGGTSTTRRGWVVRGGRYMQSDTPSNQQECDERTISIVNPVFQLHSNTEYR